MSLSISSGSSALPIRPTANNNNCRSRRPTFSGKLCGSPQPQQRLLAPPPAEQQHRKRNSFHGFCLPGTALSPDEDCCRLINGCSSTDCPQCALLMAVNGGSGMLNRANGASLLQLPSPKCFQQNGGLRSGHSTASVSPAPSEEELLLPYSLGMLKPKYSLNLRPEDCGPPGTPPRVVQQLLQKSNQQNAQSPSTVRGTARVAILTQSNRQQGSTDSAPTSAGISSKKRKEIWARAGPCSFHQSFDIRADPLSLSNSCGQIDDTASGGGGSGFRTERRSGFCSGDTSRDSRSHPGHALTLICGAPGCSGHAPCPGAAVGVPHHRAPPVRSAHSSFDEGDQREGHLRDTYLTEISREWMIMNGAIQPFKNILQQASSITSTPLANHRPIQSPAAPAAAAAVSTASAIVNKGEDGPYTAGQAIRGSCHNLAAVTAAATASPSVLEHLNRRRGSYATEAEPIIIIEPKGGAKRKQSAALAGLGEILNNSLFVLLCLCV